MNCMHGKKSIFLLGLALALGAILSTTGSAATLVVKQSGGQYAAITDALTAAQDGDIIEIQDSATYSGRCNIAVNNLTIQAAAGQKPVIDNSASNGGTPDAGFDFNGTGTLTVKGLIVKSGWPVEVRQDGAGLTLQHCVIQNVNASTTIRADGAGKIDIEQSLVVCNNTGTILFIATGGTLTMKNSSLVANGAAGRVVDVMGIASGTVTDSIVANIDPNFNDWVFVANQGVTATNCDFYNGSAAHPDARVYDTNEVNSLYNNPLCNDKADPLGFGSYSLPTGSALLTASTTGAVVGWPSDNNGKGAAVGNTLVVKKSGGQYASVTDALAAAQDGDIIEIQDSGIYSGRMNVYNQNSLTIQAAAGQKPVIDNSTVNSGGPDACFDFNGTGILTLKGLIVKGGWPVEARKNGAKLTIQHCSIQNLNGANSIQLDGTSSLDLEQSLVVCPSDAALLESNGGTLTIKNSTLVAKGAARWMVNAQNTASGAVTDSIIADTDPNFNDWAFVGNGNITMSHTDVYNASTAHPDATVFGGVVETADVNIDPAFANTGDPLGFGSYSLPNDSALLTASTTGGVIGWPSENTGTVTPKALVVKKSGGQYASIVDAIAAAKSGDTIEIQDSGTYTGRMNVYNQNSLTIQAAAGQTPVIDNSNPMDACFDFNGTGMLTLKGLIIKGGWTLEVRQGGAGATLQHCVLQDLNGSNAMQTDGAGTLTIEQSLVTCTSAGSLIYMGGGTLTIKNSTLVAIGANGRMVNVEGLAGGAISDSIIADTDPNFGDWVFVANNKVTMTHTDVYSASTAHPDATIFGGVVETADMNMDPVFQNTKDPLSFASYGLPANSALLNGSTTGGLVGWLGLTVPVELSSFTAE